ncbi:chloride channel protein [Flavitalea antarctica]
MKIREAKTLYKAIFHYLATRLNRVQYIMFVATVVGFVSGLAAVLLKTTVHYLQVAIEEIPVSKLSYLLFPGLGLLATVMIVRVVFHGRIDKGIAMVLKAIARNSSVIPLKHTYQHILTSSVTVGLGGSVGLEAPIVATGSAIGSNVARIHELNYRERTLLIGCGAASGIAAVFNAPIAGVIFAIEVLLVESIVSYFIPLIISAVIGALCSKIILQEALLFNFKLKQTFDPNNVPYYILLGVIAGFCSLYYARTFKNVEHKLQQWKINVYWRALLGGIMLMVIYFLFPPLFGEGYDSIKELADATPSIPDNSRLLSYFSDEWKMILFTGVVVLLKPLAAGITIGSGGNGGNFAPSLFAGSYLGFFISRLLNTSSWFQLPVGNFAIVGMAGMLSGVMYCPLTAIFLIAEITNGYELFIPLMIVSAISFFIVRHYEPYSMEIKKLALERQIFTHQKEKNILTSISFTEMLQDTYATIGIDKNLGDLVEIIKLSSKNIFAVEDNKGKFVGIIELHDIKQQLFDAANFQRIEIRSIIKTPPAVLQEDQDMHAAMEKFDMTNSWYIPVLNKEKRFVGFISQTRVFNKYREILASQGDLYE